MAKHIVKCVVCGEAFDLNQVQGVKHGARRYAHQTCFPSGELVPMEKPPEEDPDLIKLKDYINNLLGKSANWALITKQIKKYKDENNYTYSGMLKSLVYFHEVKKNPVDTETGGIGIIPFCYQDSFNYYYSIWQANQQNEYKLNNFEQNEVIITIPPPQRQPLKDKMFSFLEEEVMNGE